jgi:hypothetical protein
LTLREELLKYLDRQIQRGNEIINDQRLQKLGEVRARCRIDAYLEIRSLIEKQHE